MFLKFEICQELYAPIATDSIQGNTEQTTIALGLCGGPCPKVLDLPGIGFVPRTKIKRNNYFVSKYQHSRINYKLLLKTMHCTR